MPNSIIKKTKDKKTSDKNLINNINEFLNSLDFTSISSAIIGLFSSDIESKDVIFNEIYNIVSKYFEINRCGGSVDVTAFSKFSKDAYLMSLTSSLIIMIL